jgi:hypothetical protein
MRFSEFLTIAIQRSEIPLRFEPGAEESVARPVTEFLKAWLKAHDPDAAASDFDYGRKSLIAELLEELDDARPLPGE